MTSYVNTNSSRRKKTKKQKISRRKNKKMKGGFNKLDPNVYTIVVQCHGGRLDEAKIQKLQQRSKVDNKFLMLPVGGVGMPGCSPSLYPCIKIPEDMDVYRGGIDGTSIKITDFQPFSENAKVYEKVEFSRKRDFPACRQPGHTDTHTETHRQRIES